MNAIKPILFNTEMVRAILEGRKTVTRRVVKQNPRDIYYDGKVYDDDGLYVVAENQNGGLEQIELPYRPGDILYVREMWQYMGSVSDDSRIANQYIYHADWNKVEPLGWRPSIHMPREAARIFLNVTGVRAELLQDMTIEDSLREGVKLSAKECVAGEPPLARFARVWNSTIKPAVRALYGWAANPWVWVIEFERISKKEAGPWKK